MSEKLVVHSGGKLTRKTIQSGLLTSANNGFNSITASASGNYVVSYDGSGYSLVQADAAAAGIDHIDSSFFRTATGNPITVTSSGTIPYFTSDTTFSPINLPSTKGIYILNVSTNNTFTKLTSDNIFTDIFSIDGTTNQPVFPLWNGTSVSSMKLPGTGSWYLQKDSQGWNWVSMNANNIMRHCWNLDSSKNQIVTYNQGSARSIILPPTNGNYLLNNNNGTYTWSEHQDAAKQAFCVEMQVQSDSNIFNKPINITSDNYGVFTSINPTQIPTVTIGKTYRLTFHLNGYLQDTAVTENAQYTLTLSGTDVFTVTQTLQDEATNTVRLTFDTIFKPTNAYVSFSITLSSDIGMVLKRFVPCYLVVQEV